LLRRAGVPGCGQSMAVDRDYPCSRGLRHNDEAQVGRAYHLWLCLCANNFSTSMSLLQTLRRAAPLPTRICASCLRYGSTASVPGKDDGKQKVIFSGIQPTGVPHLGNYLGALRQWAKLQNSASPDTTLLFSIVDLHAITIKQDPRELATWRKEMLASLLAVGLDPKRSIIFAQSSVKQHAELMWILSCGASMGYLGRMTQWKVCNEQ
jgi:tryptophanyl-tRNA synthetase